MIAGHTNRKKNKEDTTRFPLNSDGLVAAAAGATDVAGEPLGEEGREEEHRGEEGPRGVVNSAG
jgi:hypothetical protein